MFRPPKEQDLDRQQRVAGRGNLLVRGTEQKWANSW